jgi:hypothetical protein
LTWTLHGSQLIHDIGVSIFNGSYFMDLYAVSRSRGCSVSIVSGYGLADRAIELRSPAGAKDFSSILCVQTGSGAHPASCTMSTGGPFPGAKRGRGVTLTTHPHPVPRSRMSRNYISSPPNDTMACSRTALLCICSKYHLILYLNSCDFGRLQQFP